jgi:hypothetical protein
MVTSTFDFMPPGRARGLLLRPKAEKPGSRCGFLRDTTPTIPMGDWPELLKTHTGLDPCVSFWLDQDGVGSCAAEACSNGLMLTRAFSGQDFVLLSPWSLYSETSGGSDRGSNLGDNLDLARSRGICPDSIWPRSKGWRAKPDATALKQAAEFKIDEFHETTTLEEVGTGIWNNMGAFYGSAAHAKFALKMLAPSGSTWRFKYLNSWGKDWSEPGAGEYIAEQLYPGETIEWHRDMGFLAATLHSTAEERATWPNEMGKWWKLCLANYVTADPRMRTRVEHIESILKSDEWSGRGVEKLNSSGVNFGYAAYCVRTANAAA